MKNKQPPKEAKYFKYKFTKLMLALGVAVILLCATGIGISIYRIARFGVRQFSDVLQSPFLIAICAFCIFLMLSVFFKSQYIVDNTHYTTQFGFIKSRCPIKEITALELDTDTKKLTVRVGENYSVLSLDPQWQDEFIAAIRKANPNIDFTFTLTENKEE